MIQEKKFFVPVLKDYDGDIRKRWRVEWYEPIDDPPFFKRCVEYSGINYYKTAKERRWVADKIAQKVKEKRTFKPILDKVIENGKLEWRPKTLQTYSTVVKLFQKHLNGQRVSSKEIISFLLNQKEKGKSTRTLAKYRNTLNRLFNRAIEMGLMDENPVGTIKKVSFSPQSLLYFSDKQIERFRRMEKPEQIWMAIQFLYYCFIRPGEQREMKINWISFDFGFIEIPAAYSKNKKTQKISIPNVFLKQIDFLKQYPGSFYVLSKNGKPGQEQIAINHLNYEHRKLLDKLQIRGRYAFYSWKHTGVVKAVKAGINVKDIQLQLRHHSLDMVNEYLKDLGVMDSEDLKQRFPEL